MMKIKSYLITFLSALVLIALLLTMTSCYEQTATQSTSGAEKVTVKVPKDDKGLTAEQKNISKRYLIENLPGSIKHLYVISAYSGACIIYSTVDGKVTSGGKRLSPKHAADSLGEPDFPIHINGRTYYSNEVLGDDGTYGSSSQYLYWFDTKGNYHQHFVSGGQIIHLSDQPLNVPEVIINMSAVE